MGVFGISKPFDVDLVPTGEVAHFETREELLKTGCAIGEGEDLDRVNVSQENDGDLKIQTSQDTLSQELLSQGKPQAKRGGKRGKQAQAESTPTVPKAPKNTQNPPPPDPSPIVDFDPLIIPEKVSHGILPDTVRFHDPGAIIDLIFTTEFYHTLCVSTNLHAHHAPEKELNSPRPWTDVTEEDLRAYLAILIYMGLHREPRVEYYWNVLWSQACGLFPWLWLKTWLVDYIREANKHGNTAVGHWRGESLSRAQRCREISSLSLSSV
ncbi:hypothetical protein P152DRAFT_31533 [Eremomyces bilateralis CBS 781.70]|uniref:PiggyBac transposable element-derived protein domain-containing protein n=1 Tax=Eremomyces bilateralis CBS 781.70 TaxID=1392243 RepID=A0A6G1G3B2_9PEZI|nr:uncharacterized protein P152DRAFT_31533 [Eremomyces bilateralis CBS 781.70]KAF1812299.1 hypothetical protein P152DRAFT_31533 [Eremomyces bilateralis CBS 781.70]